MHSTERYYLALGSNSYFGLYRL